MRRSLLVGVLVLALAPIAGASPPLAGGSWKRIPNAPEAAAMPYERVGVWTRKQLLVFGRTGTPGAMRNVAFSYDRASRRWRSLSPPPGVTGSYEGVLSAVWTGRQMLVWGPAIKLSYEPATNRWRQLRGTSPGGAPSGLVVWTGRRMLTWGGGCCGDVTKDGWEYDPVAGTWRKLPQAPIAGQQRPLGGWTGRELVVLPGRDPDNRPTGGAAYDPGKRTWRRIAAPPQERSGSNVVWDDVELLVVGGSGPPDARTGIRKLVSVPLAYDPATNRWRELAAIDQGRYGRDQAAAVWTGKRLLVWGGKTQAAHRFVLAPHGLAYDPRTNRWAELPGAPLVGRLSPLAVWTGTSLLLWGGDPLREDIPSSSDWWPFLDGASFTPAS